MPTIRQVVSLANGGEVRGLLNVLDSDEKQIVIRFIPYGEEHITIHNNHSKALVKTHWMPNKPLSINDQYIVEAAAKMGWANPHKHKGYVVNSLFTQNGLFRFGEHIITRRFQFIDLSEKKKYSKPNIVTSIDRDTFYLGFYFSRIRVTGEFMFEIITSLGYLYVIEEN